MMKSECAWCGKSLGERPGPDGAVTHGICDKCREVILADFYAGHPDLLLKRYDIEISK